MKKDKITGACSLTNILSFVKAHSENTSKSLFDITCLIDSITETIDEDFTMDEVTIGKMLFMHPRPPGRHVGIVMLKIVFSLVLGVVVVLLVRVVCGRGWLLYIGVVSRGFEGAP